MQVTVGIRELKAQLSQYVREVKSGKTVIITEHGKPVGRIVPVEVSLEEKIQELIESGFVVWNGQKLMPTTPVAKNKGKKTVAEMVLEDRE